MKQMKKTTLGRGLGAIVTPTSLSIETPIWNSTLHKSIEISRNTRHDSAQSRPIGHLRRRAHTTCLKWRILSHRPFIQKNRFNAATYKYKNRYYDFENVLFRRTEQNIEIAGINFAPNLQTTGTPQHSFPVRFPSTVRS
ncbi:hypothetical protein P5W99_20510 [Paraburkholderia sp. A3BS-1L]|uniref:hypothetical protein n=1 Tax=Paraburkholderia sp. A3BS-1L TaxID=3028375 RepID=UPI003DA9B2A4